MKNALVELVGTTLVGLKNRGEFGPSLYELPNSGSISHLSSTALDLVSDGRGSKGDEPDG